MSSSRNQSSTGADAYPIHFFDHNDTVKPLVMAWTLRFNDVLDADQLHNALVKLLQIGDWRKLGGRLRLGQSGKLEIHVPEAFTAEYPAVAYTHDVVDVAIEDHPVGSKLPISSETPSLQHGPAEFECFAVQPTGRRTLEDFLDKNEPLLGILVTSFTNATLVSMTWPHLLMDGMGFRELLKAWSLVLAEDLEKVPPLLGARTDFLYEFAENTTGSTESHWIMQDRLLTGLRLVWVMVRALWDMAWYPVVESRTIFLPRTIVEGLQRRAQEEAESEILSEKQSDTVVVSKGDVLLAWLCQMVSRSQSSPRSITALSAVDLRGRLPSLPQANGSFIQNLFMAAGSAFSKSQLRGSLGQIAALHRRQLTTQMQEGQMKGFLTQARRQWDAKGRTRMLFGNANDILVIVSNRDRADIFHSVDFGPAAIHSKQSLKASRPVYHHSLVLQPSRTWRNVVVINGRDHNGGFWLTGLFTPKVWKTMDVELARLAAMS